MPRTPFGHVMALMASKHVPQVRILGFFHRRLDVFCSCGEVWAGPDELNRESLERWFEIYRIHITAETMSEVNRQEKAMSTYRTPMEQLLNEGKIRMEARNAQEQDRVNRVVKMIADNERRRREIVQERDERERVWQIAAARAADVVEESQDPIAKAVLALHEADYNRTRCAGCEAECTYCEGTHSWPCPTIITVGVALGAQDPGDDPR